MAKSSIGIVGCGAIARAILRAVDGGALDMTVAGVTSRDADKARAFLGTLATPVRYLSRDELIAGADIVVEAAGPHVVPELARDVFDAGKTLMLISVGALLDHPEVMDRSRETGCRLLVPSGAIAGLDGIKAACVGEVDHVTMVSRKPPAALDGAPYVVEHEIDLWGMTEEQEIFSGSAREACAGFPNNLNVSAAVSFAGIGPDRTTVEMVAVPGLERNCHDIEIEGEFGLLRVHIENIPGENPKTGKLTAMSIIRTLQQAVDPVQLGT
ncbi:MAG: aspartate dehydrogenase [Chloroflexi bacterium]|nr:aspartate dehydrogenase [Chloroflexota bacterium]